MGETILHHACLERDIDIVDLVFKELKEVNSDIDFETQNIHGETPIQYTYKAPNTNAAIELLKRFPQKIHVLCPNNSHVLHEACASGHLELVKYIDENFYQ